MIAHALEVEEFERLGVEVQPGRHRIEIRTAMGEELRDMWDQQNLDTHADGVGVLYDYALRGELGLELRGAAARTRALMDGAPELPGPPRLEGLRPITEGIGGAAGGPARAGLERRDDLER